MSKKTRNFLSIIFLILFLLLTIALSFYAAGYRFVWRWPPNFSQLLQKTGMIVVESSPSRAIIIINEQEKNVFSWHSLSNQNLSTPAKIKNLLPGEYKIRLEKEDYWPADRAIKVFPNQTSYLTDIFLLKKSSPLAIFSGEINSFILSPDRRTVLIPDLAQVISLRDYSTISLIKAEHLENTQWSRDNKKIFSQGIIYNLNTGNPEFDLKQFLDVEINNFYWDERGGRIFYQAEDGLSYFSLNQEKTFSFLENGLYSDFLIRDGDLYALRQEPGIFSLNVYDLNSSLRKKAISLPTGDYKFFYPEQSWLNLYDHRHQSLILIKLSEISLEQKIINKIDEWKWLNDNHLLWRTEREIYSWFPGGQEKLLIRSSQEITGFAWHNIKGCLIYSSSDSIQAAYFQDNKINIVELLRAENISSITLDERNNLIYFIADRQGVSELFKLEI